MEWVVARTGGAADDAHVGRHHPIITGAMKKQQSAGRTPSLDETYPAISDWVMRYGWIELGQTDYGSSMVRVLDEGGLIWEGKPSYRSLDELFGVLEKKIAQHIQEIG